jgi:hypothetical protein
LPAQGISTNASTVSRRPPNPSCVGLAAGIRYSEITVQVPLDQGCTFVTDRIAVLTQAAKEEESDVQKAVRALVRRGQVLLDVERYKRREASSGKAPEAAGLPVGQRMTLVGEFGVRSRIDETDYRQSLANIAADWQVLQARLKSADDRSHAQPSNGWSRSSRPPDAGWLISRAVVFPSGGLVDLRSELLVELSSFVGEYHRFAARGIRNHSHNRRIEQIEINAGKDPASSNSR